MNAVLNELDVVRISALLEKARPYTGTEGICRAPRIGDLATVVHVLDPGSFFVAEAVDADGYTLWLADFRAQELQLEAKHCADI